MQVAPPGGQISWLIAGLDNRNLDREEKEYFAKNYRWLPKEESTAYEEQQRHDDDSSSQLKSFATISQESFL